MNYNNLVEEFYIGGSVDFRSDCIFKKLCNGDYKLIFKILADNSNCQNLMSIYSQGHLQKSNMNPIGG